MLTNPILAYPIKPFDATKDYEFIFYVNGGNQVLRNNLIIENVSDNVEVYNQTIESFSYKHKVLANMLVNGTVYKVKIRTGGLDNTWSQFSEYQMFYCLTPAIITIPTIDYTNQNRVYNQTVNFEAVYTQSENEQLQSYRFLLFDSNKDLIKSFPEQFYSGSGNLSQEITGLDNGTLYYIQVKTESVNGLLSGTELIWFKPLYITPRLSLVLTPENLAEQGAIKLSANIVQIIGKLYDNNGVQVNPLDVEYIDGEWLDLTRFDYDKLNFDDGFNIAQSDFTMKLWCKNIPDDKVFLTLNSPYGKVELMKYNNRIHAIKTSMFHKLKAHFISDEFDFTSNMQYMIYLKQTNNLIDMVVVPY